MNVLQDDSIQGASQHSAEPWNTGAQTNRQQSLRRPSPPSRYHHPDGDHDYRYSPLNGSGLRSFSLPFAKSIRSREGIGERERRWGRESGEKRKAHDRVASCPSISFLNGTDIEIWRNGVASVHSEELLSYSNIEAWRNRVYLSDPLKLTSEQTGSSQSPYTDDTAAHRPTTQDDIASGTCPITNFRSLFLVPLRDPEERNHI
jgi:hypothetical protein